MLDRLRIFSTTISSMLTPGEHALALQAAMYVDGREDLGQRRETLLEELESMLIGLPTERTEAVVAAVLTGTSLVGWPGCAAQQLAQIAAMQHDLLVTDRRVLLVDIDDASKPVMLWSVDRSWIRSIDSAGRFAQAGRIRVTFADGSSVALMLGVLSAAGARRVVDAWHGR